MTTNSNLPTAMQILNAFDGVSVEQLQIIIDELRNAAANDDEPTGETGAVKAPAATPVNTKEPILEL